MDCCLGSKPKLLLHFHLDPQTLSVKAVLVALVVSGHRKESLLRILISAPPGMMDAHWVVGRDGAIQEAPSLATCILLTQLSKDLFDLPELQDRMFTGNEIAVSNGLKHGMKRIESEESDRLAGIGPSGD